MTTASDRRASPLWLGVACLVAAGCALTFVIGSTVDEEEFRFAVLSAWLRAEALGHGGLGLWTPLLGLGMPQPFTPNFVLHPLLPLLALMPPAAWARVLLVVHTLLGAAGMWRLARHLGLTRMTQAACIVTFLLAAPSQNYSLTDFWPSHFIVWTSSPWLLLMAWRMLETTGQPLHRAAVLFGVCGGLVLANTNPGHIVVYAVLAAAVLIAHPRQAAVRWGWLAIAGLLSVAIAAPNLAQLAHERALFSPDLPLGLGNQGDPLPPSAALNAFLAPFGPAGSDWPFTRTLFFGGPFAVLAVAGAMLAARRRADLTLTVLCGALLLFTTVVPLPFVSARFHVRDPMTLAAILLAGLALDRLATSPKLGRAAGAVVVAQIAVLVLAAWPALERAWSEDARRAEWFRGATGEMPPVDTILRLAQPRGRLLLAPQLEADVYDNQRVEAGLGVNALAYRDVPVVNGWFKGVSTAVIWPDERMLYGRIATPAALAESPVALDLLGIRWVLAYPDETVASGLRRAGSVPLSRDNNLVLYENTDTRPSGFLLDSAAERMPPTFAPGCRNERLLCTDFAALSAPLLADSVNAEEGDDSIEVEIAPSSTPRLLVLSTMYREDWTASTETGALDTVPVFGALLGVRVPPGIASLRLRYNPVMVQVAAVVGGLSLSIGLLLLVVLHASGSLPQN